MKNSSTEVSFITTVDLSEEAWLSQLEVHWSQGL
jgi:hypothetical protein